MTARWVPLGGTVAFLGIACWRAWRQRRRHGSSGILLFSGSRWQEKLRDALGIALVLGLLAQAVVAAVSPASLSPLDLRPATMWRGIGTVLTVGGLVLLVIAQLDLGASWRIGIKEGARPGLVTSGLYRFCRNPIFLAILLWLLGYTLVLPTRLSIAMLVGAVIGIRQQVLTEESYLSRAYGDDYRGYARRVGRFLPGIGKLR